MGCMRGVYGSVCVDGWGVCVWEYVSVYMGVCGVRVCSVRGVYTRMGVCMDARYMRDICVIVCMCGVRFGICQVKLSKLLK